MKSIFLAIVCFLFSCTEQKTPKILVLESTAFEQKIAEENVQLVDVRTESEWNEGIIEGALLIDFLQDDFATKVEELDKSKPIAVYCRSGGRSGKASKLLKDLGFNEIYDLKGGYLNWNK